jgi:hypothetical protein
MDQVLYHVHESLPFIPILSQKKIVLTLPSYAFKINFNIILPT